MLTSSNRAKCRKKLANPWSNFSEEWANSGQLLGTLEDILNVETILATIWQLSLKISNFDFQQRLDKLATFGQLHEKLWAPLEKHLSNCVARPNHRPGLFTAQSTTETEGNKPVPVTYTVVKAIPFGTFWPPLGSIYRGTFTAVNQLKSIASQIKLSRVT